MKKPDLSIVVVNWNGAKLLYDCLSTLSKQSFKNFEVVVVDNGSKDDSVVVARSFAKKLNLKLVLNQENLGFAEANNRGVKAASSDYCLLLNNDTLCKPSLVFDLASELEKNKGAAVLGVDTLSREGKSIAKDCWTMSVLLTNVDKTGAKEPFYPAGCAVLLDRRQMGQPFDSDYFIYGEDTALGWRARLKGKKVAFTAKPKVVHLLSSTGKKIPNTVAYYGQRNRLLNYLLFYSKGSMVLLFPLFVFSLLLQALYELATFRVSPIPRAKAYWWILSHPLLIAKKRKQIQNLRKVPDSALFPFMSCKIAKSNFPLSSLLNFLSCMYCKFIGISTID